MSGDDKKMSGFAAPANTPIIGQPFTLLAILIPVTATMTCNCGSGIDTTLRITLSAGATCPGCGRVWNVAFNPTTSKIEFSMALPGTQVPS